jgi:hypothetical protein
MALQLTSEWCKIWTVSCLIAQKIEDTALIALITNTSQALWDVVSSEMLHF